MGQVYALPDLSKPVYVAEGLCYVPPHLSADYTLRRGLAKENLREILVADLGDTTSQSPYLIVSSSLPSLNFSNMTSSATKPTISQSMNLFAIYEKAKPVSPPLSPSRRLPTQH